MPRSYRGRPPKPDSRGYYRPEVGGKRFTLGNKRDISEGEVARRLDVLRVCFDRQCEFYEITTWDDSILWAVECFASTGRLRTPALKNPDEHPGLAEVLATRHELYRELGLPVEHSNSASLQFGIQQTNQWVNDLVREEVKKALEQVDDQLVSLGLPDSQLFKARGAYPDDPVTNELRTFHEALEEYRRHKKTNGKRQDNGTPSPSVRKYIAWTKILQEHHEDFPVWQLDGDRLESLVSYWRNRPKTDRAKGRISMDYAKHMIDCLWSVCTWVDSSSSWKWEFPRNANRISRTPHQLDADRRLFKTRRISDSTYTPEQLARIAKTLGKFEKLILGLSVNCAFQPAEIGRAEIGDYYETHPETGKSGPWFIFHRPKTHIYGEWLLWKEVAQLVEWGVERSRNLGAKRLIVTDAGEPWYRESNANESIKFGKWWQAKPSGKDAHSGVVTRIQNDDPSFPRHTIKTLRKILPNLVRPKFGKEVADIVNARTVHADGRMGGGEIERYSDSLFEKGAEAIRTLEGSFRPFLDALAEDE